jgi:hypothetical protein
MSIQKTVVFVCALFACTHLMSGELPAALKAREPAVTRLGTYALHWLTFRVYDAALYTESTPYTTNGVAVLSLSYHVSITHRRLQETTLKEWQRLNKGTAEQRAAWIKQLDGLWPDIKPGDSLSAYRTANGPTAFYFGDRLLGAVADAAFGPAFFAIWLDENCRYPKMRNSLLGKDGQAAKRTTNP